MLVSGCIGKDNLARISFLGRRGKEVLNYGYPLWIHSFIF
jgi:hypothetical protein